MVDRVLPYYKWFWQDWRANRKIQRMSYIERGLYRELLDECWVEGFIPNDIDQLADICGCPTEVMASAWQVLSSCFIEIDGFLVNEKLHSLRTEKDKERLVKSENGKKGGIAKAIGKHLPSTCHIEEKIIEKKRREDITTPEGVSESIFKEYLAMRKKAKKGWTERIQNKLTTEGNKLGWSLEKVLEHCLEKEWIGFEAAWVKKDEEKSKELPLGTDQQIAHAYKVECGGDPTQSRFNSYYDMRKFILDQRDKRKAMQ